MDYKVSDLVTRNSYNNDVIFKIVEINDNIATLKGVVLRLEADSPLSDLKKYEKNDINDQLYNDKVVDKIKKLKRNR